MATTYYQTDLTKEQIEQALHAVNRVASSQNNGKVLYIDENGEIKAKSAAEWQMRLIPKTITQNGNYDPASDSADGYSSITANIPNSYTAADEGKVVSNGALVAQTARTPSITENGTYDTTGNNSVTVNVSSQAAPVLQPKTVTENGDYYPPAGVDGFSEVHANVQGGGGGSSGVYVGTTAPDSSMGSNGEYYYQRTLDKIIFGKFLKNSTSSQKCYGYEFTSAKNCVLKNFKFRCDVTGRDVKIVIGTTADVEAESSYVQSINGEFVLTDLADFEVEANVNYVIKAVTENSNGLNIAYGAIHIQDNLITRVRNRYGTSFPGTQEIPTIDNFIAVIFDAVDEVYHVNKEYYKSNGQWSEI